jgi:hypothetical protein
LAIEAALLGQGVALARTSLVGDDLASGRLVRPIPQAAPTTFRYFLVCRSDVAQQRKVACFREWLISETRRAAGVPSVSVALVDERDRVPLSALRTAIPSLCVASEGSRAG